MQSTTVGRRIATVRREPALLTAAGPKRGDSVNIGPHGQHATESSPIGLRREVHSGLCVAMKWPGERTAIPYRHYPLRWIGPDRTRLRWPEPLLIRDRSPRRLGNLCSIR